MAVNAPKPAAVGVDDYIRSVKTLLDTSYGDIRAKRLEHRADRIDLEPRISHFERDMAALCSPVDNESRKRFFLSAAKIIGDFYRNFSIDLPEFLISSSKLGLDHHAVRPAVSLINELFILECEMEITTHGLMRSFRFWSDEEKRVYLRLGEQVISSLSSRFPLTCYGYGAVLSYVRSQDLMAHDDDLDLIVAVDRAEAPTIDKAIEAVCAHLASEGWQIWGSWASHRKVFREVGARDVDVFVGLVEGEHVSFLPGPRRAILCSEVFPPMVGLLLGEVFPIPRQPETYLEKVYGADWRVPTPGWHHNWSPKGFEDILR